MRLYLDNEQIESAGQTLGEALRAGVAVAERRGRIVVEVQADGAAVPEGHLASPPGVAPYAEEIRLVSAEPRALVRTTLLEAADALDRCRAEQTRVAELLQVGKTVEAMDALSGIVGTWEAVRQAVQHGCTLLAVTPERAMAAEGAGGNPLSTLATLLGAAKRAIAVEDWTSLADVLAYDLADEAARWRTGLVSLADLAR